MVTKIGTGILRVFVGAYHIAQEKRIVGGHYIKFQGTGVESAEADRGCNIGVTGVLFTCVSAKFQGLDI